MSVVTIATPPFATLEAFREVMSQQGAGEPEGLIARYVGEADGQLRIVAVWESKELALGFFAGRLAPALEKMGVASSLPQTTWVQVLDTYVREPSLQA